MWPFDNYRILELEEQNKSLLDRIVYLEALKLSETERLELEFLRKEIAPYITYDMETSGLYIIVHEFYPGRTLRDAERDLTKARFYISVLEAQLGPCGIEAVHEVCERLKAVCGQTKVIG